MKLINRVKKFKMLKLSIFMLFLNNFLMKLPMIDHRLSWTNWKFQLGEHYLIFVSINKSNENYQKQPVDRRVRVQHQKQSQWNLKMVLLSIPIQVNTLLIRFSFVKNDGLCIGLDETCHVYKDIETDNLYTAVLGMVDITCGTNSYYKIQLLESDSEQKWFVFRSW